MNKGSQIFAPAAGVVRHLQPWEVIAWTDAQLRAMYTDWGSYFARKQKFNTGTKYFDAALKLQPNDKKALLKRSQVKRKQAQASEALIDCSILRLNNPLALDSEINLEICDALYESNRFEKSKQCFHRSLRVISNTQAQPMRNRLLVVNRNIHEALSDDSAPAVHRLISKMTSELAKQPTHVKPDCDVLSILEKEEKFLSPLEKARRERQFKIYNQTYLHESWMDATFLKKLRENPNLLLKQCTESTDYLRSLTNQNYKIVRAFTKMLHARCPMYCKHLKKYPNKELYLKYQQENFFRIQHQTRRTMFKILQTIRGLIRSHDMTKLTNFVEEVMGDYVTIKTNRIMPWKFEFVNEVYNYLGVARIKEYKISSNTKILTGRQRLLTLLKIPIELGNASNVKDSDIMKIMRKQAADPKAELFKRHIARFEDRMRFAKLSIERSYLYHEAAQANLDNHFFDACCLNARRAMDEAVKGKNYIWAVLSALTACKAHAVLGKVEKQKEMLVEAFQLSKYLKNIDLILFIDICLKVNAEEMELKKTLSVSEGSVRRRAHNTASSFETSIENSTSKNSKTMVDSSKENYFNR